MSTTPEVGNGTGIIIAATLLIIGWAWAFSGFGYISKDSFQ